MNFKNLLVILSMGMVFSALCATTPENVDKEKTEVAAAPTTDASVLADEGPIYTHVDDMKTVDVECVAYLFWVDDGYGFAELYAFESLDKGMDANGVFYDYYYTYQQGCVLSEGSVCYATKCGWDYNF